MKRLLFLIPFLAVSVFASDITINENRKDSPGNYITTTYRDVKNGSYAPTFNSLPAYNYADIASTSAVKITGGVLHSVVINKAAAQAFTVYDSTAASDTTRPIAAFALSSVVGTYLYDVLVTSGIFVNEGASGPDVTITYW